MSYASWLTTIHELSVKSGKVWEMRGFTTGVEHMLHLHFIYPPRCNLE